MGTKIIGIRLTLTLAVGIFLLTVLLFAAAMIIANALSIPEPAARFLPFSARGLPGTSDQPSDDASLANGIRSGRAESKDEPVPTVTAVPEPPRSGAPMVSSGGERATQTRPTIHRWVTSGNREQADAQGPAPYWWNQIPRAPEQPGSTPSSSPTPRSTTRVPRWRSPGYRPTVPEPSEPEPTEPAPSEAEPSEPAPTASELTEPTASEPTGSEPTEPLASESATE
jgi:DNA polymerase-3 subunit gamma/tau